MKRLTRSLILFICALSVMTSICIADAINRSEQHLVEYAEDTWSSPIRLAFEFYRDKLIPPEAFESVQSEPDGYVRATDKPIGFIGGEDPLHGHYGTLRGTVVVNERMVGKTLGIINNVFSEDHTIWVNGVQIVHTGQTRLIKQANGMRHRSQIGIFQVDQPRLEIVIHFSRHFNILPFENTLKIGTLEQLQREKIMQLGVQYVMAGGVLIMAIYHFIFYWSSRRDRLHESGSLYFALLCMIIAMRVLNIGDGMMGVFLGGVGVDIAVKLSYWSMFMMIPASIAFVRAILPDYVDRSMEKLNRMVAMILAVVVLVINTSWYSALVYPFILYVAIAVIKIGNAVWAQVKGDRRHAKAIAVGFVLLILVLSVDIFYQFGMVEQEAYLLAGLMVFTMIQAFYLATRYTKAVQDAKELAVENTQVLKELEELNSQLESTIEERTDELETAVTQLESYTDEMQVLLDSVGQGFLMFGSDLKIGERYSAACNDMLQEALGGKRISEVLYGSDLEQRLFFETIVQKVMTSKIRSQSTLYMTLLPQEVFLNHRFLGVSYRLVGDDEQRRMVMTFSDVTEQKRLEDRARKDQSALNMIVTIVVRSQEFIELLEDYRSFCSIGMIELMDSAMTLEELIFEVLRQIHTFKGNFGQFDMQNTVDLLHSLETEIMEIKENIEAIDRASFREILVGYRIERYPDKDLTVVNERLGEGFLKTKKHVMVPQNILLEIEESIQQMGYSEHNRGLIKRLRSLRFKTFKSLLRNYPDYVSKLAEKTQKSIHYMRVEGDDFLVDTDYYSGFTKSLVHVFRNMVDHGIEYDDERQGEGKPEFGTITCAIEKKSEQISLVIADDGRGIDINNLRDYLFRTGQMTFQEAVEQADADILKLIFEPGFSTKLTTGELSGRGIGLSAVMTELERIHGEVRVVSTPGEGTTFQFTVPLIDTERVVSIPIEQVMDELMEVAVRQVEHFVDVGLEVNDLRREVLINEDVQLLDVSAIIQIRGLLDGILILSVNHTFAQKALKQMELVPETTEESTQLVNDIVGEAANFLIGNVLRQLPDLRLAFRMEAPLVIRHKEAKMQFTDYRIHRFSFNKHGFAYSASLIMKGME